MTKEQKQKLIKLRCKAWGITEDEYYCNQCSDFSLEDMARAYRRGKNKVRAELEAEKDKVWWEGFDTCKAKAGEANVKLNDELEKLKKQLEELPDKWCRNKDDYCPHLAKLEKKNENLEQQIEKMQETLKSDLIARLKENISYSTSPSCTKGMELFIKSIEEWEIKEK